MIVLLKALCGGSNIDIDAAASKRGAKRTGSDSWGKLSTEASGTIVQPPGLHALSNVLTPYFGDLNQGQIMLGAVVLFVAFV